ncbi:hypothetical protein D3C84_1251160 [compost metagenome]
MPISHLPQGHAHYQPLVPLHEGLERVAILRLEKDREELSVRFRPLRTRGLLQTRHVLAADDTQSSSLGRFRGNRLRLV